MPKFSLFALTLLFSATAALANEVENPNALPFGEQEAFLGNTGIALEDSSGAVYYNPGALGFVNDKKISIYGNAYAFNRVNLQEAVGSGQPDLVISANSSSSIPLSSVTVFGAGPWTFAFSLNTPYTAESEMTVPYSIPAVDLKISQSTSEKSLWVGPTVARQISPDFAVGASLFGARFSSVVNSIAYVNNKSANTVATTGTKVATADWSAILILGAQWRVNPEWTLGLRAQSASLDVKGRTEYFVTSQTTGATTSSSIQEEKGIDYRFRRPFNFGLGGKYVPNGHWTFLADLNAQLPIHYNTTPSRAAINTHVDTRFRPRANLGAKWLMAPTHRLLVGFLYNPSTLPGAGDIAKGEAHENLKGITAGLQKDLGALVSSVGGFYFWSSGEQTLPSANAASRYSHQIFGLLLTASYHL